MSTCRGFGHSKGPGGSAQSRSSPMIDPAQDGRAADGCELGLPLARPSLASERRIVHTGRAIDHPQLHWSLLAHPSSRTKSEPRDVGALGLFETSTPMPMFGDHRHLRLRCPPPCGTRRHSADKLENPTKNRIRPGRYPGRRHPLCSGVSVRAVKARRRRVGASASPACDCPGAWRSSPTFAGREQSADLGGGYICGRPQMCALASRFRGHGHAGAAEASRDGSSSTRASRACLGTRRRRPRRITGSSPRAPGRDLDLPGPTINLKCLL